MNDRAKAFFNADDDECEGNNECLVIIGSSEEKYNSAHDVRVKDMVQAELMAKELNEVFARYEIITEV